MITSNLTDKKIYFIDLETSGFSTSYSEIYQLAALEYSDKLSDWKLHNWYFNPTRPVSAKITGVTGLTTPFLRKESQGYSFDELAPVIKQFLDDSDILAGHNIKVYDIPLLKNKLSQAGVTFKPATSKLYDTLEQASKINPTGSKARISLTNLYHTFTSFGDVATLDKFVQSLLMNLGANEHELHAHNAKYDVIMNAMVVNLKRRQLGLIK